MQELIRIKEQGGQQAVSAKELYLFLEVQTEFSHWVKRMFEYGFMEGVDFTSFLAESTGGRPGIDYALTLDCAKEISMLQRSDRGKQARLYFIEMEKRARQAPALALTRKELALMLLDAENEIEKLQVKTASQERELVAASPKVQYHDTVLQSISLIPTTIIAKELGMSAITLNKRLHEMGIQHQVGGVWVLYAKYQDQGWTGVKTTVFKDTEGREHTTQHTYWTERGRQYIHTLFNRSLIKA